jgi:hypothetical protein
VVGRHTDLNVGRYVGSDGVDRWSGEKWYDELENHHVLIMTSQVQERKRK